MCPIAIIFGIVSSQSLSLGVIERWFHFPPHLSSATTLPWEITEHKKFKALSEGIHLQAVIGYREKIDRPTVGWWGLIMKINDTNISCNEDHCCEWMVWLVYNSFSDHDGSSYWMSWRQTDRWTLKQSSLNASPSVWGRDYQRCLVFTGNLALHPLLVLTSVYRSWNKRVKTALWHVDEHWPESADSERSWRAINAETSLSHTIWTPPASHALNHTITDLR